MNFSCIKGEKNPRYAERYVSKYPIGKRVNVYYKSDEPTFSVLEPYVTYPTIKYFLIYVTLSFITTIICIVLHLSQKRFKAENE